MQTPRSALVVAATPSLADHLCEWLKPAGWIISTANSYASAKCLLAFGVDLVVTELELGDYNGLQLALRTQNSGVPTVVVGHEDAVLERDAGQLGSVYLRKGELDEHRLLAAIDARFAALRNELPPICRNVEFVRRPFQGMPAAGDRIVLN